MRGNSIPCTWQMDHYWMTAKVLDQEGFPEGFSVRLSEDRSTLVVKRFLSESDNVWFIPDYSKIHFEPVNNSREKIDTKFYIS